MVSSVSVSLHYARNGEGTEENMKVFVPLFKVIRPVPSGPTEKGLRSKRKKVAVNEGFEILHWKGPNRRCSFYRFFERLEMVVWSMALI